MSYKISVIIPVYNAEKHLENTINSIIKQSIGFENIELILVDDASKDNSKKIIESYSEKYSNIIPYFSEKNHGYPGFGRNIGLNTATSDYIMFMDNDDEYDVNMCETLYETMINENADIVVCGRMMVNQSNNIEEKIHHVYGTEENGKIIVNTSKEKSNIKIEIKNQGEPIPEEEREKIFERFYRVDKARNRSEKRYGLGLSIAKGIVEKYNGNIYATSKEGFTSFIVKI